MLTEHAAYAEESKRLCETLSIVSKEKRQAEEELALAGGELAEARVYSPDDLPIKELLYDKAVQTARNMALSQKKPYFTRVDFTEDKGDKQVYYIGKYGVMDSATLNISVIDWRAPLANLYYAGQLGHVSYMAPDGAIEGELTLKRQFSIEDGALLSIFDTDIVSQDAYLQAALNEMTGDKLREIVTTIQAEQNFVIRHPLNKSLIVEGVAGSGKTTIALHRIAYLLYAFQEKLQPKHMLILAPNPLFLNFIAGVLPDLGVEKVRQTTFSSLIAERLGKALPRMDLTDRTEKLLAMPEDAFARASEIARFKGALAMEKLINDWVDAYEKRFAPDEGMRFGPVTLFTKAELDKFLLVDEKPFPMERRVKELQKQLKSRAHTAAVRINQWLTAECERREATLAATEKDEIALCEKLRKLHESLEKRVKQTLDQVPAYVKQALKALPTTDPGELYLMFLTDLKAGAPADSQAFAAADYTLARAGAGKPFEPEDIAPISMIAERMIERARMDIRHVVVDEAQDFNPLEYRLLTRVLPGATFTVVGDRMQGVHAWRGLTDLRALARDMFPGCVTHNLSVSYRNTVEIMTCAMRVAKNRPTPDQVLAKPVERHGETPEFVSFKTVKEQAEHILSTIRAWTEAGLTTIAVVDIRPQRLKQLMKLMPPETGAYLMDINDSEYRRGTAFVAASSVKGLEFDGVILSDAGEDAFPDRELEARLLYVSMTRPLHRLKILYSGALTPLLR